MEETSKKTISFASTTGKHCIHNTYCAHSLFSGRFSVFFEYKGTDGRFQKDQSTIECVLQMRAQEGGNIFKSFNQSLVVETLIVWMNYLYG